MSAPPPFTGAAAQLDWAIMLIDKGQPEDRGRANELLDEVDATGHSYGLSGIISQVGALLGSDGPPLPR